MANRFIDTGFYRSPFVRSLEGPLKVLFSYIICDCSSSGIWIKDLPVASLYTGFPYTDQQFEKNFINKGKAVDLLNGKFFFPDFIQHQYPNGLQEKNPAHKNAIKELFYYDLLNEDLTLNTKGLGRSFEGPQVTVTVTEMVNKGGEGGKFKKPDILEVQDYMNELSIGQQAQRFYDFYESNGWKVGKNPMKDWRAACRNWKRNQNNFSQPVSKFDKLLHA